MSVVVYLPPNLVGLKISDCTVAMAGRDSVNDERGGFGGFGRLYFVQLVGQLAILMESLSLEGGTRKQTQ